MLSVSDAAYGAMPNGANESGTMVLLANPDVLEGDAPVCIGGCQLQVSCEVLMSLVRAFRRKISGVSWQHVLVTDAGTSYDAVNSETLPTDRKIAIDVGVLLQGLLDEIVGCLVVTCSETA